MLARITGRLESMEGAKALIALPCGPDGVGTAIETLVPGSSVDGLMSRLGEIVTLHTLESLEAQGQGSSFVRRVMGFESREDRRFFELFTTVKGVGGRKALRAMAAPTGRIARAIAERDAAFLQTLPEIGKRLAETVVAELHGKVEAFITGDASPARAPGGGRPSAEGERAVAALVRLGEQRQEAERLVRIAMEIEPKPRTADDILAAAFAAKGAP